MSHRRSQVRTFAALAACAAMLVAATPAAAGVPAAGTTADEANLRLVPGSLPHNRGHAIPLEAARPDWFTPGLRRRVVAADGRPVAAPPDAPLPGEVGIRPGSWMIAPSACTMNFVFAKSGQRGIGTAGHCAKRGKRVVLLTLAPSSENPVLVDVGRTVISRNAGIGRDFALVEIRPRLHDWVFPTTAVVGGPCGRYFGSGPETVAHYGHGLAIGTGGTPRAGVALTWRDDSFAWDGAAIFGDSGSPVRVTDLRAAGNLTHLIVSPRYLPSFIAGTRIGQIEKLNGSWRMVDSSLCPAGSR